MVGSNKFIVVARTDGLGVQLMALVNAIRISEIISIPFEFTWVDNMLSNQYHSVRSAEHRFSKDFLFTRLGKAAVQTPPMPHRLLKMAEAC